MFLFAEMSKPDTWMPFYGNEFFASVKGRPEFVGIAYLKVLWHYWHHNHCKGLPNEDDYLRRVCECDLHQWEYARGVVFDNKYFFILCEDALWRQKRCDEEWEIKNKLYKRAMNGGLARSAKLNDEERSAIARKAIKARWTKRGKNSANLPPV